MKKLNMTLTSLCCKYNVKSIYFPLHSHAPFVGSVILLEIDMKFSLYISQVNKQNIFLIYELCTYFEKFVKKPQSLDRLMQISIIL